jgi:hypothetical protein
VLLGHRISDASDGQHSAHAAAKARYYRNDCYMREIFCRQIDSAALEGSGAAPDPEGDGQLVSLLQDAIKRTRDEVDELAVSGIQKRSRADVDLGFINEPDMPAADGSAAAGAADAHIIIQPLLQVGESSEWVFPEPEPTKAPV